jgi:hypothetical protein
LHSLFH